MYHQIDTTYKKTGGGGRTRYSGLYEDTPQGEGGEKGVYKRVGTSRVVKIAFRTFQKSRTVAPNRRFSSVL